MTASWWGSGAAGLVAALTTAHQGLSTIVVEKAAHYGGSTVRSGGSVWIPNSPPPQDLHDRFCTGARFAGVVFPGEALRARIWKEGKGFTAVVTAPGVEFTPA